MSEPVSVNRDIAAPPSAVWPLIIDLPRMGEWSPEATGGTWMKGATAAAMGTKFRGTNTNTANNKKWSTIAKVVAFEAEREFAFEISAVGMKVARWDYTIEPTSAGCTVTETWTDYRSQLIVKLGGFVSGVADRSTHNRAGMETTLANLAKAVESPSA